MDKKKKIFSSKEYLDFSLEADATEISDHFINIFNQMLMSGDHSSDTMFAVVANLGITLLDTARQMGGEAFEELVVPHMEEILSGETPSVLKPTDTLLN